MYTAKINVDVKE